VQNQSAAHPRRFAEFFNGIGPKWSSQLASFAGGSFASAMVRMLLSAALSFLVRAEHPELALGNMEAKPFAYRRPAAKVNGNGF
jgi:hypothetical protein